MFVFLSLLRSIVNPTKSVIVFCPIGTMWLISVLCRITKQTSLNLKAWNEMKTWQRREEKRRERGKSCFLAPCSELTQEEVKGERVTKTITHFQHICFFSSRSAADVYFPLLLIDTFVCSGADVQSEEGWGYSSENSFFFIGGKHKQTINTLSGLRATVCHIHKHIQPHIYTYAHISKIKLVKYEFKIKIIDE